MAFSAFNSENRSYIQLDHITQVLINCREYFRVSGYFRVNNSSEIAVQKNK